MLAFRTILHPTDFSTHSGNAFRVACSLARDLKARLIIMHVVHPPTAAYGEMFIALPEDGVEVQMKRAQEALNQLLTGDLPVVVETRVEEGDAATEILRVAQENGSDLIVIGTHGRTGLSRLLMGSVAEQVLRRAPCPVLTVKAPVPETSTASADANASAKEGKERSP